MHAGKNAVAGRARRTDGQKFQQAVFIDVGRDIRVAEERFWLGAKDQRAARIAVEERLGAGAVTIQKQFAGSAVPDRKGKNAVQAADKIPPIVQVGAENDFRVGGGGKKYTQRREAAAAVRRCCRSRRCRRSRRCVPRPAGSWADCRPQYRGC